MDDGNAISVPRARVLCRVEWDEFTVLITLFIYSIIIRLSGQYFPVWTV